MSCSEATECPVGICTWLTCLLDAIGALRALTALDLCSCGALTRLPPDAIGGLNALTQLTLRVDCVIPS
ncbi:hypothetical protein JKP88DRAFT_274891 [Tribonema minus]|uniref:Uncharacterized protein n=1 Tax=Tribonema minus TaxID=303371 RepID=A0A836CMD9_9STRA|nr:hypothetical protein JKP88DRAFT_274891 [Tribonema minus]